MEIDFPQISISTYYGCPLKSVYLHTWAPAREAKVGYCHVAPHPLGKSGKNSLYGIFFYFFSLCGTLFAMWGPFCYFFLLMFFFLYHNFYLPRVFCGPYHPLHKFLLAPMFAYYMARLAPALLRICNYQLPYHLNLVMNCRLV